MKEIYFLIFLTGIMLMEAVLADASYKQPIFTLEFNIYGTGAEIRFNDFPVYYHDAEGQTSSQIPIPESIIDGENILTIRSFTLEEDGHKFRKNSYVEAIISVREKNAPLNKNKILLQLKLNPGNPKNKLLDNTLAEYGDKKAVLLDYSEKLAVVERRTNIKSPFPRWAWQDGQFIDDSPENFNSLVEVYKEIWNALNSGDRDKIRELYDPAAKEFADAYHYGDKQNGHRIMNTGGLINDPDWGLGSLNARLDKRKYYLDIYADGRMARLIDTKKNESLITYLNKNVKMVNFQKFGFYKNKNNEWVMIR